MLATNKNRLAKVLRWTARIIGFGLTGVLFIASIVIINYGEYIIADVLLLASCGISLGGCIASQWQEWFAGILFMLSGAILVTVACIEVLYTAWQGAGILLLIGGGLFIPSWWVSRRINPPATPPLQ